MSQVHFQQMTFEELVKSSPVIVVARGLPGPAMQLTLEFGPGIEPYRYIEQRWQALEVLRCGGSLSAGKEFILTSMSSSRVSDHVEYYIHRISRSTIEPVYTPDPPLKDEPGAARILFLARQAYAEPDGPGRLAIKAGGYSPVCAGAAESILKRDEVVRLAAAREPVPDRIDITVGTRTPDDRYGEQLRRIFPGEKSFSWRTLDLQGERRDGEFPGRQ